MDFRPVLLNSSNRSYNFKRIYTIINFWIFGITEHVGTIGYN